MSNQGGYEPGWYPNPEGGPGLRWYDGNQWTDDYHFDQPGPVEQYRGDGWGTGYSGSGVHGYPGGGVPPELSPFGYFKSALTTKYADFSGRARRAEYWWFVCFSSAILFALVVVPLVMVSVYESAAVLLIGAGIWWLATLLPAIAVGVRRLHDTGKSGAWLLVGLVPLGGVVLFILMLVDGDRNPNQYGWPVK